MNLDGHEIADEYIVTAERIFEFCGADSTLRVDVLMDKFAPFVKTNKAEYSYLRSLLDPHQSNPEITVSELADTLSKYSESQKIKVDLDESFNSRSGLVPQDSDSGISTDGFQLLEELQCELREKAMHLQQLRRQLTDCEALHEDALAAAAAERRTLQEQLNVLREENGSLNHVRRDYEDVCERLCAGEKTLDEARAQLEGARKRARDLAVRVEHLETERQSLTELLSRSKAECHRINEKYASRQSALLERDETLRRERAELQAAADRDQRHLQRQLQRLHAEKVPPPPTVLTRRTLRRERAELQAAADRDQRHLQRQLQRLHAEKVPPPPTVLTRRTLRRERAELQAAADRDQRHLQRQLQRLHAEKVPPPPTVLTRRTLRRERAELQAAADRDQRHLQRQLQRLHAEKVPPPPTVLTRRTLRRERAELQAAADRDQRHLQRQLQRLHAEKVPPPPTVLTRRTLRRERAELQAAADRDQRHLQRQLQRLHAEKVPPPPTVLTRRTLRRERAELQAAADRDQRHLQRQLQRLHAEKVPPPPTVLTRRTLRRERAELQAAADRDQRHLQRQLQRLHAEKVPPPPTVLTRRTLRRERAELQAAADRDQRHLQRQLQRLHAEKVPPPPTVLTRRTLRRERAELQAAADRDQRHLQRQLQRLHAEKVPPPPTVLTRRTLRRERAELQAAADRDQRHLQRQLQRLHAEKVPPPPTVLTRRTLRRERAELQAAADRDQRHLQRQLQRLHAEKVPPPPTVLTRRTLRRERAELQAAADRDQRHLQRQLQRLHAEKVPPPPTVLTRRTLRRERAELQAAADRDQRHLQRQLQRLHAEKVPPPPTVLTRRTLRRERAELQAAADRDQRHLQRQLQRLHAEKVPPPPTVLTRRTLRRERAELQAAADRDQRHLQRQLQRLHAEKILLEMELKDVLNKSDSQLRPDRSVDVSYTDDQILSALDSLNADSRFTQENRLLDEESFVNALKEDQGRPTNLSLYDEIRLSFCNMSRHSFTELNLSQTFEKHSEVNNSCMTVGIQTDNNSCICKSSRTLSEDDTYIDTGVQTEIGSYALNDKDQFYLHPSDKNSNSSTISTSTSGILKNEPNLLRDTSQIAKVNTIHKSTNTALHVLEVFRDIEVMNFGTQTDVEEIEPYHNNNNIQTCIDCMKCVECERLNKYATKLEGDIKISNTIVDDMQRDMNVYEENLNLLKKFVDEGNERNIVLKSVVDSLRAKLDLLESACTEQNSKIEAIYCDVCSDEIQTDCEPLSVSTQTELPYAECDRRAPHRGLKRYLWNSLKGLLQVFVVVCFACAVWVLCGVTGRTRVCPPPCTAATAAASPWRWMHAHELLDLFLTIENAAEVPM